MNMRLLHIHSGNLYGGVETLLATLARYRGLCPAMEPEFALCFDGRIASELREAIVPVHQLGKVRARYPLTVIRARQRLRALLRHGRFDAAVCHMPWAQAVFGPVVRSEGVPIVFWMHDAASGTHWLERWARRTTPDHVLCNSKYTAASLGKLYPRTPHTVCYLPVATGGGRLDGCERRAMRAKLGASEDTAVIVQTSRMEAWKGHALHLQALGFLRDLPGWVCWMVGGVQRPREGRYLAELHEMVAKLGVADRVQFLGQRFDIARLLRAADIYCQPNTGPEPFGISVVEALLAELPVVTTALGGANEIVDVSCGITVEPGNPQALAEVLHRLIEDFDRRRSLGELGPERAAALCDPGTQLKRLHAIAAAAANRDKGASTLTVYPIPR
jgi:glycosyltransferase involved in cell wall biosynthesis